MPDTPTQPQTPPTAAPSSPTLPSGTPTSDSPELANMVAPEYRYPDNETVPQYLRGKTASDAAQLLDGLVKSVAQGQTQAPIQQQQPISALGEDDYVTRGHLQQAQQQALSQVSPWL